MRKKGTDYLDHNRSDYVILMVFFLGGLIIAWAPQMKQNTLSIHSNGTESMAKSQVPEESFKKRSKGDDGHNKDYPSSTRKSFASAQNEKKTAPITSFDPNTITVNELIAIGLPEDVAHNWKAYLKAGGTFKEAEDIRKIYGLKTPLAEALMHMAIFPPKGFKKHETKIKENRPRKANVPIDINLATAEDWQKLRGIGPVLSDRIVKFRSIKKGFSVKEEIKETYGITDSLYQTLVPFLLLKNPRIDSLMINRDGIKKLIRHPMINYQQAKVIVRYRVQHGDFKSKTDLMLTAVIDSNTFLKIRENIFLN